LTVRLYGLAVRSPLRLPGPRIRAAPDVELAPESGSGRWPAPADADRRDWFVHRRLRGGATFVRWRGLFEFLISRDGRRIEWRRLPGATPEAFTSYLLSQVLSFSLLARGTEPLHASVVEVPGGAIGFLGGPAGGKSSLSAAFVRAGHRLVTDDLLALARDGGSYRVQLGVPRIKLYPRVARELLGFRDGVGRRMNPHTTKLILPLPRSRRARQPPVLTALYVLARGPAIRVRPLTRGDALLAIVRASFNTVHIDRRRLARQFASATRLAHAVPVRRLTYPRRLSLLPRVRAAILTDLAGCLGTGGDGRHSPVHP
jgi:hypothetical protein